MQQETMDLGGVGFGDPPATVVENVAEMSDVMRQRRAGNELVMRKNDTERYLVIVYADRGGREAALAALGLPSDERYLAGEAIELRLREGSALRDAQILTERGAKAAGAKHSGAAG